MMRDKTNEVVHNLFEQEIYLALSIPKHNFVVATLGAYVLTEPHISVIEFLPRGNLRDLLRFVDPVS